MKVAVSKSQGATTPVAIAEETRIIIRNNTYQTALQQGQRSNDATSNSVFIAVAKRPCQYYQPSNARLTARHARDVSAKIKNNRHAIYCHFVIKGDISVTSNSCDWTTLYIRTLVNVKLSLVAGSTIEKDFNP